jgi:Stage II sporulation protein E (SpoIIE)
VTRRRVAARGDRRGADARPVSAGGVADSSDGSTGETADIPTGGGASDGNVRTRDDAAGGDGGAAADKGDGSPVTRTVRDIVEVVPDSLKVALAALAALSVLLGAGSLFSALRARRLDRQRRELLKEVGLLQSALLPPVPARFGTLRTSVAYRPADGPGAGGDFYDAVELGEGRTAFILGDVSGHGRDALERTAFIRFTLRAYLGAGLEPRGALKVAGRVIEEHLGGDFATVLIAVHDPGTGSLTYASAGHPAPIVVGPSAHEPVLAVSSPPIGVGVGTGLRQTSVPLVAGSVACLYTDGLTEARTEGGILGRGRLQDLLSELGRDATAEQLLDRVADDARLVSDDMAACLLTPTAGVTAGGFRTEELELSAEDLDGALGQQFLAACGVSGPDAQAALEEARQQAERCGGAVLHVVFGNRRTVEALPRNVESLEAASRRAAAS